MAAGAPVIQPRRGAFPEILEKTRGGVMVEPGDVASLAQAIYKLWKSPAWAAELARNGARGVREHFTAARMAARALEVFQTVAAAWRAPLREALKSE
jgi:glycosyltransferase involved in cell wall biosynthesis